MVRDKAFHHDKIVAAAMEEFMEYGFNDASMRRIASKVGMSVSGLYKHFASKEEMFSALVEPAYQGLIELFDREVDSQRKAIEKNDISVWENSNDAKMTISYIYDHLDAFRLIVSKSQGTQYEDYLHSFAMLEEGITIQFMEYLKENGHHIKDYRKNELHLLVTTNVSAAFQAVENGFTREEAMHYADTLDRFFSKAWAEFFGY
jgi:AcrR family transcriptional regulator